MGRMQEKGEVIVMEDTLNNIGILTRREIEARILAPFIHAMGDEFGRERVLEVARQVIDQVARQQGEQLARSMGGCTLKHFADSLEAWKKGDAIQTEILEQDDHVFSYNVTRCRYAEMYRALGDPELGVILSCGRDFALVEGFNPEIRLKRTQTIMEGAAFCDFRYSQSIATTRDKDNS